MKKLPNKLSKLILVALEDLEKVESMTEKYRLRMNVWYSPDFGRGGKCNVCFAGSVMAMRLNAHEKRPRYPFSNDICPDGFSENNRSKLMALNQIRCGDIYDTLFDFHWTAPWFSTWKISHLENIYSDKERVDLCTASDDPGEREEWKLYMQDIAGVLAAEGY